MYLKRKIDIFLKLWKQNDLHKPLIIKGARQIGKTESIMQFAKANYKNIVYINFALEKKFMHILEDGYDVNTIIKNISVLNPAFQFIPNETIIIFDELQEYPDIATSFKSFSIDKRFDVISSGSMLGINYKKIHSNSVGYKEDFEMFSMDFEEFLWANGYTDNQIESIYNHMLSLTPFNNSELIAYKRLFLDYCVLGGMPEVVKTYIANKTFTSTLQVQKQIALDYEEDARKYASGLDQAKIISVYRSIPAQLAKENKKFQFSKVTKNARAREYSGCIDWLSDSGIINICYCLNFPELPLKGNIDNSKFKVYIADTGLLISMLDEEAQNDLRANKNLGVYKGALYENFVAEAFKKQGLGLYYYKKDDSSLEEDFFLRTADYLVPIEVKSNSNKSKSLSNLISSEKYSDIKFGIKLGDFNIGFANNIYTFPYFCSFLIKKYLANYKFE